MVVYSIKDLEKLSGVKAHTLRIWEKRYGLLKPKRTPTNIRYYLDDDLKILLNVALLNRNGIKISKIAKMERDQIQKLVAEITDVDESFQGQLDSLTISLLELDEAKFVKLLNKNIEQRGFTETMLEVIYPLLDKLAMMWISGSIKGIHEKFVSYLIKRKCIVEIDKLEITKKTTFLIYLPEEETNELSLLFLHYLIKKEGFNVVNAGTNVNVHDLMEVEEIKHPDYIFTIINDSMDDKDLQKYVRIISKEFKDTKLILSGLRARATQLDNDLRKQVITISSSEETIKFLHNL